MILPSSIKSKHRLRDAKILTLYASGIQDPQFLGEKFKLTPRRINQIVKSNVRLVIDNADYEKLQRLNFLKAEFKRPEFQEQTLTKKDALDLWRKEFETDKGVTIDQRQVFQVYFPANTPNTEIAQKPAEKPQLVVESSDSSINTHE